MTDVVYGCLNLQSASEFIIPIEGSKFDFRRGNHLTKNPIHNTPGEFIFAQNSPIEDTSFVPSRNEKIDAIKVGSIGHEQDIRYIIKMLLHINSEKNNMFFPDLVHDRLYKHTPGTYLTCISQSGPHSHFIFLIRNIQLYMMGVTNNEQAFLIWTNEHELEERLKIEYGNKYYYYRFPAISLGSLVIQTKFICARYKRWNNEIGDRLKIFSALERLIMKNLRI